MSTSLYVSNLPDQVDDADPERYRLLSIEAAHAPDGCAGPDWYVYRIAQGVNAIIGYRRGPREGVRGDVETIVAALNGRRQWTKRKSMSKAERRAATAIRVGAASRTAEVPR